MPRQLILAILVAAVSLLSGCAIGDAAPARRYLITDSGAVGDGQSLNTKAIQSAIDRCAADGGGTVVIPKGTFMTGSVFLKQGVNLAVEKDGVLKGTTNRADYPNVQTRWEGVERQWTAALLNATNMTDVSLSGEGTIDGSGDVWEHLNPRRNRPVGGPMTPLPPATAPYNPSARPWIGRPRMIVFQNCKNMHVSGLNLRNEASWGLVFIYCQDVLAEGLTVRVTDYVPSSDGMDIDSSVRVHVNRCDIQAHDDCISIKSGRDADGLRVNRPSEDILIENTRFGYGQGAVAIGSETSGSIRNVEVRDCVVEDDNWAAVRLKSAPSRGGVVENITYRNIQIHNVRQAFEINPAWSGGQSANSSKGPPVFRNVTLINVSGTAKSVGRVTGLKDSPLVNIKFEGCNVTAQSGMLVDNVLDLDVSGLNLKVAQGEPIIHRTATLLPTTRP